MANPFEVNRSLVRQKLLTPSKEVSDFHKHSDVDSGKMAQHHTLGLGPNQAAPGSLVKQLMESFNGSGGFFYVPTDYGAIGDGTSNDTAAVIAACNAAEADGGGIVLIHKHYGFNDVINVGSGVYLQGVATRQNLDPSDPVWDLPGLVAIGPGAQLKVGDWSAITERAGGVMDLVVDGADVGGDTVAKEGLVRIAGVATRVENLFCHRSVGDGVVYDGLQNSTITGGQSTLHGGCSVVLDNGPGSIVFLGGYYGTSQGGVLLCRDTAGEGNLYPFGPTVVTFTGTIFESYDTSVTSLGTVTGTQDRHIHLSGVELVFNGCNFTGGAPNSNNATILIDASASIIPSSVTFNSCLWWTYENHNAIRIVGEDAIVVVDGYTVVSDDGTHHTPGFVCIDGTQPRVILHGHIELAGANDHTRIFQLINGGSANLCGHTQHTGVDYVLRSGQQITVKTENDANSRLNISRLGEIVWGDGAGGFPVGLSNYFSTLGVAGIMQVRDGFMFEPTTTIGATGTVTCDCSTGALFDIRFGAGATVTIALSNTSNGRIVRLCLLGNGSNTLNWPTIKWAGAAPVAPADTKWLIVDLQRLNGEWLEVNRSLTT